MIIKLMANPANNRIIKEECILLSIALLIGGNRKAQEAFLYEMRDDENNSFLY